MAVPRPVLLALLGLGLLASVFLVTRSKSSESVKSSTAPVAKPAVTPTAPEGGEAVKGGSPKKAEAHRSSPGRDAKERKQAGDKAAAKKAAAKHGKPKAPAKAADAGGVEGRVLAAARALGEDKAVVFFFSKPGAADDVGARIAMKSLRGMDRVEIFDASLDELAAYRPMLASIGISQIPSTVIVRPGKKAILLQGFVDAGTLRQNVADALR